MTTELDHRDDPLELGGLCTLGKRTALLAMRLSRRNLRLIDPLPSVRHMKPNSTKYSPPTTPNRNAPVAVAAPLKTLRLGRIKAAIWENGADERVFFNVTFARTYMDEEKRFRDTDSFGRDDLLLLAKLADLAHSFICERQAASKSDEFPDHPRRP